MARKENSERETSMMLSGKIYIGKKFLQHKKTKKLGKKAMAEQTGPGRKKTKEVTYAESDWKTYWGSCKPLHEDVANIGEDKFYKEIALGSGFGLRYDFSFFVIRLDAAIRIYDPQYVEGKRWLLGTQTFKQTPVYTNFGIGYPF